MLSLVQTVGGAIGMVVFGKENKEDAPPSCGFNEVTETKQKNWTVGYIFLFLFLFMFSSQVICQKRLYMKYVLVSLW